MAYQKIHYQKVTIKISPTQFATTAFISWLIKRNSDELDSKTKIVAENQITQSIQQAEEFIHNGKLKEAKILLDNAIKLADENEAYENVSSLCDLLASIILSEGDFYEAENVLVKFIERLLQLGYPETHNSIVTFKLKLARIYQLLGSLEMSEYGFRDCIRVQEKKLEGQKQIDEESNAIYITALFWYGKLLADQQDFKRARKQYTKCWERILKTTNILPSQKMVVLHNIANVSAKLNDFDAALHYLYSAIEICLVEDPDNTDLPIFIVQVGLIFLQKEIYESALFWCQTGHELASHEGNEIAKKEGLKCLDELRKLKILT
ncbi:tetratricopeptide repeat protein 19 homolog, mitochondrial-like isoform X2 [Episyrphus balteatus]|uniref:tetratricopeptide repeat protein 19 homolog, mitochondrial-like isoform X2 n=1 Tax=Episyrphus balteatus TaxID=286459 RepID=UPI00248683C4|nr:tetratricopeptide repeat protein 19 homolog, mitochondrial-like isoform X2 [Episyrphus balteatus]